MAGISIGGIASGLPPNLVDQLIEAERQPIKTIEKNKGKQENRLKLVQELETKLNGITASIGELASTKGFSDIKLNSGDPNVIAGTVDPRASTNGNWNIEVMELAQKPRPSPMAFSTKIKRKWVSVTFVSKRRMDTRKFISMARTTRFKALRMRSTVPAWA